VRGSLGTIFKKKSLKEDTNFTVFRDVRIAAPQQASGSRHYYVNWQDAYEYFSSISSHTSRAFSFLSQDFDLSFWEE